jgi:IclR family KDG regulon transcriptional repressor
MPGRDPLPRGYRIRALEQAGQVIGLFRGEEAQLTLPQIARRIGVSEPTAHKLVLNLEAAGLLERNPWSGHYQLPIATWELGARALRGVDPWHEIRPHLERLQEETGATATAATLKGARAVFVEHVRNDGSALGRAFPAHATALGKVLLAHLEIPQLDALVAEFGLEPWTERTITDRDDLVAELERIRERGYAIEDEEYDVGLRSIAAPVRDHTGQVVAALGVLGPADRLTDGRINRLADAVVYAAGAFSRSLGAGCEDVLSPRRPSVEVSGVVEHTPPLPGPSPTAKDEPSPPKPAPRRRRPPARGRSESS